MIDPIGTPFVPEPVVSNRLKLTSSTSIKNTPSLPHKKIYIVVVPLLTLHEHLYILPHMRPDKKVCLYCGKEIEGKKLYCSDAHRMAYKRQGEQEPEQNVNPNTNKPAQQVEQILPEQPESEQPEQDFRSTLTKTDKTFYDRAMKDFGEPYYKFGEETHDQTCLHCSSKFKTSLAMLRFCSYSHYKDAISGRT